MHQSSKKIFFSAVVIAAILVLILLRGGAGLYVDWLWFKSLNYEDTFLKILLSKVGLHLIVGAAVFAFIFINLLLTRKKVLASLHEALIYREPEDNVISLYYHPPLARHINSKNLFLIYLAASLVIGFLVSISVTGDWVTVQKYLNSTPFNMSDPVFEKDIGFYVFKFPFYQFIYRLAIWTIIIAALCVALIYLFTESGREGFARLFRTVTARFHLGILAALFFAVRAWGYKLEQYGLLFSGNGVIYGPGYTDIHTRLLAYKVLMFLAAVTAVVILITLFLRRFRLVVYSIGAILLVSILLGGIYPAVVQNLVVKPNELNKEKPYIERAIEYTNLAYKLDDIERKPFPAGRTLTAQDIEDNPDTINNIRLWDWRPITQTYSQLQEMRPYYKFENVDIDRYVIDGRYRQVMLAAREMDQKNLPQQAKTWVNMKLKYTHGYGIVMSPVNEMTVEGLPKFFLKNVPPVSTTPDLKVKRPEIYYGEGEYDYVIVNTDTLEFDYPISGDKNAHTTYKEKSGVTLSSFFRKVMFALAFGDYKLLLASDINENSQILFYRNIKERVPRIAPFLRYDSDPYIVLSDGKLYWLWDAYTVTNNFPYSEPFLGDLNYIRNSVKVVVDAYNGNVTFYIADTTDPLIQTYKKIFPDMFLPLSEMSEDLRSHLRYPCDFFMVQAKKYAIYHMKSPEMFYNQEDIWHLPTELFGDEEQEMEPYYTISRLPGEKEPEFILILPFTPKDKKNMIAWLAGRSDGENYGKLLVYEFPKQELVYGPMQIEARINQDTVISQLLTLWNQQGSSVIRGNLLIIPVEDALLYVEPLYLQASQSRMPELRRVIVAHGDQVVMETNLNEALEKIFGELGGIIEEGRQAGGPTPEGEPVQKDIAALVEEANRLFEEAERHLKEGSWAGYGESLQRLKQTLKEMKAQLEKNSGENRKIEI